MARHYHYYTVTTYRSHDLEMGDTELVGPFRTPGERLTDIEAKRQNDDWNLQEDTVTILLLRASSPLKAEGTMQPVDPAFEEDDEDEDLD